MFSVVALHDLIPVNHCSVKAEVCLAYHKGQYCHSAQITIKDFSASLFATGFSLQTCHNCLLSVRYEKLHVNQHVNLNKNLFLYLFRGVKCALLHR